MGINSLRRFKVTVFDREDVKEIKISLEDLINPSPELYQTELLFAMQDIMDDILDLKLWDRLLFFEYKGDKNSHSIIIRTQ